MSFSRYPKYKDSGVEWLGEVPEGWEVVQFKQFVDIQNGGDHKHIEQDEGYPVIGSGGCFAFASEYVYDGESILLGRKGTIDKPLYVTGKFWTVDTMYWSKIREMVSGRYAYYTAQTIPFAYYSTNTALPSMTKGVLNSHIVCRPPYPQQQAIATFLDRETAKIDALVAEQENLIALLKEKRQAVISHAVTKGLDPTVPMKDSGIEWLGEVPAHWEVKRLKQVTPQVTVGIVVEPSKYYVEEGIPALRSLNVGKNGEIQEDSLIRISEEGHDLNGKSELHTGDLVAVRSGQPGTTAVIPAKYDGCNCIDLIIIRKPFCGSEYFLYWFLGSDAALIQFVLGSGGAIQQHFNVGAAINLVIPWPTEVEQRAIVDYLDTETAKLDELTTEARHTIDLLKERRSALISAAVTGKIDVRGYHVHSQPIT